MDQSWKLSPSDLTFLWDECPRCFYLKVVQGFNRPQTAFPKIFSRIDKLMKGYYENKPTAEVAPELPDGVVMLGEKWVTSQPIQLPGHHAACFIKGKFDSLVSFADRSYGVIDFKTSETRSEHVAFYSRQLHAYAYALENPAPNCLSLSPVSRLGLLCIEPVDMQGAPPDQVAYIGKKTWLEIPLDYTQFLAFLEQILFVLEQPEPPASNPKCVWCNYRQEARERGV
jgi:hypothetical protein